MADHTPPSPAQDDLRVYVVDDDAAIRVSLERGLRARGFSVESHGSAASFLDTYDGRSRGCLILDYGMPGMNGLELQHELNARRAPLAIIFITGHGGVPESVQAIKGGALNFLEKPFSQAVLVEQIELAAAQLRAQSHQDHAVFQRDQRLARLTPREREIVDHILAHPSETSSKSIAARMGVSPRTIDHHRARILEKLGASSLVDLLAMLMR